MNVIHCMSYEGVPSRQKNIDVYLIRQNTEGEYAMQEHEVCIIILSLRLQILESMTNMGVSLSILHFF